MGLPREEEQQHIQLINEDNNQSVRFKDIQVQHQYLLNAFHLNNQAFPTHVAGTGGEVEVIITQTTPSITIKKFNNTNDIDGRRKYKISILVEKGAELFSRLNIEMNALGCEIAWPTAYTMNKKGNIDMICMETMQGMNLESFIQSVKNKQVPPEEVLQLSIKMAKSISLLWQYGIFLFDPGVNNFMYDPQSKKLSFVDVDSSFHLQTENLVLPFLAHAPRSRLHENILAAMDKEKPHHWNEKVEWLQEQYVIYNIQDIVYQLLKYVSLQDTIIF